MTIRQAADRAGKDESTLRHAIKTGKLKALRIGPRTVIIHADDLQAWLDNKDAHRRGRRREP